MIIYVCICVYIYIYIFIYIIRLLKLRRCWLETLRGSAEPVPLAPFNKTYDMSYLLDKLIYSINDVYTTKT